MHSGLILSLAIILVCKLCYVYMQTNGVCFDGRSAFKPGKPLAFCSDYSEIGCCGESNDDALKDYYEYIQSKVTESDWTRCQNYVKDILCARCFPYATTLHRMKNIIRLSKFPGLCRGYCREFYPKCRYFLWFLDPPLAIQSLAAGTLVFCDIIADAPIGGSPCYPEALQSLPDIKEAVEAQAQTPPECVCVEEVKSRLANPVFARPAWDGSGRMFVVEQEGKVHIYKPLTNTWEKDLFLNIRSTVVMRPLTYDERGLFGLAFHPQYDSNGRIFLSYFAKRDEDEPLPDEIKDLPGDFTGQLRISEVKTHVDDPNKIDMRTEKIILQVPQPDKIHNGGEFFFGDDGHLYVMVSDGGGAGDPLKAGQDKSLLFGKILRLDVDSDPSQPYTIPNDNPFIGESGTKPEIYALGIRNTWKCGFDRGDRETGENKGRVLCGDVGQARFEEINLLKKGANYGWNAREGLECFDEDTCGKIGDEELPIVSYNHFQGVSVIGGVFYRGCQSPNLKGLYVYGDYLSRRLWTLESSGSDWTNTRIKYCNARKCIGPSLRSRPIGFILSFGEDEDGEAYILTSLSSLTSFRHGFVYRIVDPSWRNDPTDCEGTVYASRRLQLPRRRDYWFHSYKIQSSPLGETQLGGVLIRQLLKSNGIQPGYEEEKEI